MAIEAIPTTYSGCLFRSRTEARWAAFWDLIGLRWEYEPEGFKLPDGTWYLPDFWLPDMSKYAEVKPTDGPTDEEWDKVVDLAAGTGHSVLVLDGAPWPKTYTMAWMEGYEDDTPHVSRFTFCWHDKYLGPDPHDGEPRIYWQPAEHESEDQRLVAELMAIARKMRMDEPRPGLPLGYEGVEVVG